jgi:hypothetical protein
LISLAVPKDYAHLSALERFQYARWMIADRDPAIRRDGWLLYRARWEFDWFRAHYMRNYMLPPAREWDGRRIGSSTPLLLVVEQGLGDAVQFLPRYLEQVCALASRVWIVVPPPLLRLVADWAGHIILQRPQHDLLVISRDDVKRFVTDLSVVWWTTDMTLPALFEQRDEALVDWSPTFDPSLSESLGHPFTSGVYLRETGRPWFSLGSQKNRRDVEAAHCIVVCWWANLKSEGGLLKNAPAAAFGPLVDHIRKLDFMPWVMASGDASDRPSWVDELRAAGDPFGMSVLDLWDTAAWLWLEARMIVTVDTALAHLGGLLGIPTLLCLPHTADSNWRWGTGRSTFWYPSLRIVRQEREGDWDGVLVKASHWIGGSDV